MTTDIKGRTGKATRRIARVSMVCAGLLGGWFAIMVATMFTLDISANALVFGDADRILANTDQSTKLLNNRSGRMVVTSTTPGYVQELYAAGAWLVLPSLAAGCLELNKS